MKIHLVTYATPRFRMRQLLLGWSARANHIVDTVKHWTPELLSAAGFEKQFKGIKLSERGSGFWAWKPFIIAARLSEVEEGDLVFYCDVGRRYPFKELTVPIDPLISWMESKDQDVMPGLSIPWKGHMAMWTKRDAFVLTGMDRPDVHEAIPIQASFSLWKKTPAACALAAEWLSLARQRPLISDDSSQCGLTELPEYHDHRHDQSLLTLCCHKHKIVGLDVGMSMPPIDTQHPSEIVAMISDTRPTRPALGHLVSRLATGIAYLESLLRSRLSFGEPLPEPHYPQKPRL